MIQDIFCPRANSFCKNHHFELFNKTCPKYSVNTGLFNSTPLANTEYDQFSVY